MTETAQPHTSAKLFPSWSVLDHVVTIFLEVQYKTYDAHVINKTVILNVCCRLCSVQT